MKYLVRNYLITLIAVYLSIQIINSFSFTGGNQTLLFGAFVFMLINMVVKPIAKIFFFPINIITVGLFSFIINALMLYLLTIILPQFSIKSYFFPGFSGYGFVIPAIHFSLIATFVIIALIISIIVSFLHWLTK